MLREKALLRMTQTTDSATQVLITVDNEVGEAAADDPQGFEKFVLGIIGEQSYGSPFIAKIANEYSFPVEFFTDIYESAVFGAAKYEQHCQQLVAQGHFIQLHTHPGFEFDLKRRNLYQYTLDEQNEIIQTGAKRIASWVGRWPTAHRAGMYGADSNTLDALITNGICIDSSYYHQHPNCKLNLPTVNSPFFSHCQKLLEIPVTTIKTYPSVFGIPISTQSRFQKLDVNGMDAKRITAAISKLNGKVAFIVIFLHSSSFIKRESNGDISVDKIAINSFRSALTLIKKLNINVTSFEQISTEKFRMN
jgi:hypothetical protein